MPFYARRRSLPAADVRALTNWEEKVRRIVARHLTDFWLEYRDAGGTLLSGNPLSAAQREQVKRIVLVMEGFDTVGPMNATQLIQVESEIMVRNAGL